MIESGDVMKLIDKHVKENPVIIFMKGTPSQPQCGFSAQSIRILNAIGVEFASVNVLDYPSIREGIKAYSYDSMPFNPFPCLILSLYLVTGQLFHNCLSMVSLLEGVIS